MTCKAMQHLVGVCLHCHAAVLPLAVGTAQEPALHPVGASSGVWLVYL